MAGRLYDANLRLQCMASTLTLAALSFADAMKNLGERLKSSAIRVTIENIGAKEKADLYT